MGRLIATEEEQKAGEALFNYLRACGNNLSETEYDDRPDLRCFIDGRPMGCEIVGLIPADMQQAIRVFARTMFRRKVDVAKITIPIEPHMWMRTAIERKWAKVQKYPKTPYTENLSLLVHHPMLGYKDPVEYDRNEFVTGVQYGQAISNHGFANVFYWSGRKIYHLNHAKTTQKVKHGDLSKGYPAYIQWILSAGNEGLRENFEDRSVPLALPRDQVKHIKPMDPDYQGLKPHEPEGDFRMRLVFDELGSPSNQ